MTDRPRRRFGFLEAILSFFTLMILCELDEFHGAGLYVHVMSSVAAALPYLYIGLVAGMEFGTPAALRTAWLLGVLWWISFGTIRGGLFAMFSSSMLRELPLQAMVAITLAIAAGAVALGFSTGRYFRQLHLARMDHSSFADQA